MSPLGSAFPNYSMGPGATSYAGERSFTSKASHKSKHGGRSRTNTVVSGRNEDRSSSAPPARAKLFRKKKGKKGEKQGKEGKEGKEVDPSGQTKKYVLDLCIMRLK
tara:strand:- start:59 stop:376 length:318 start_codon:yes stop_codon:yes gene_type:complete